MNNEIKNEVMITVLYLLHYSSQKVRTSLDSVLALKINFT